MPVAGTNSVKTLDYKYDLYGNITEIAYQKQQPDDFYHYFYYDADKRLKKVLTSDDGKTKSEQAEYIYYKHGPLKRVQLANKLQGIDYVYTIEGWLKSINSPELNERDPGKDGILSGNNYPKDLFGMTLDYFAGDYGRAGTYVQTYDTPEDYRLEVIDVPTPAVRQSLNLYNGIIKGQRWKTVVPGDGNGVQYANDQLMEAYQYDNKYQLKSALFSIVTNQGNLNKQIPDVPGPLQLFNYKGPLVNASNDFKVWNINYDPNGNIRTLKRNGYAAHAGGLSMDELSYNYNETNGRLVNNKLRNVVDNITSTGSQLYANFGFDPGQTGNSDNYHYSSIGEQIEDHSNTSAYFDYDIYGKVIAVYDDQAKTTLKIKYTYDERGYRIKKSDGYTDTWFVNNTAGQQVSIYQNSTGSSQIMHKQINIYGKKRIGVYDVLSQKYIYELTDHLENVRSTFTTTIQGFISTGFDTQQSDDYLFSYNSNLDNTTDHLTNPVKVSSVKLKPGDQYGTGIFNIPVKKDQIITGSYWCKTSGATTPNAMLVFALDDATTKKLLDWDPFVAAGSTTWTEVSFTYKVAEDGLLSCYPWSPDNVQTVWFDDLTLNFTSGGIIKVQPLTMSDYYAHGSPMPGRVYGTTEYRYGYQGQYSQMDAETGMNAFEARMYDARLGRWITVDPARQYYSPYNGMGNNPICYIDKDGKIANFIIMGIAGAVIGGTFAAIDLAIKGELDLSSSTTWKHIGVGAASGAITAMVPPGLAGAATASITAFAGSAVDDKIDGKEVDWGKAGVKAGAALVGYGIGELANKVVTPGLTSKLYAASGSAYFKNLTPKGILYIAAYKRIPWYLREKNVPKLINLLGSSAGNVAGSVYNSVVSPIIDRGFEQSQPTVQTLGDMGWTRYTTYDGTTIIDRYYVDPNGNVSKTGPGNGW
jgi:RHS repeat-associated protein